MKAVKSVDSLTEQDIRTNLLESIDWKETESDLLSVKDTIDEEAIGLDVDPTLKKDITDKFYEHLRISKKLDSRTER